MFFLDRITTYFWPSEFSLSNAQISNPSKKSQTSHPQIFTALRKQISFQCSNLKSFQHLPTKNLQSPGPPPSRSPIYPHLLPQQFGDAPPALGIQQQVPQQVAQLHVRALPFAHGHLQSPQARGPGPGAQHGRWVGGTWQAGWRMKGWSRTLELTWRVGNSEGD